MVLQILQVPKFSWTYPPRLRYRKYSHVDGRGDPLLSFTGSRVAGTPDLNHDLLPPRSFRLANHAANALSIEHYLVFIHSRRGKRSSNAFDLRELVSHPTARVSLNPTAPRSLARGGRGLFVAAVPSLSATRHFSGPRGGWQSPPHSRLPVSRSSLPTPPAVNTLLAL